MRLLALLILCLIAMTAAVPTTELTANATSVAPGQSVNYTIDVRGTDPLGRTTSVYFDAAPGMTIWHVESFGADGCIQPSEARAQCTGTVGASSGMLMFVSARASTSGRCADFTAHARADDHLNPAAEDWLTLPLSSTVCLVTLPLIVNGAAAPMTIFDPYPGP